MELSKPPTPGAISKTSCGKPRTVRFRFSTKFRVRDLKLSVEESDEEKAGRSVLQSNPSELIRLSAYTSNPFKPNATELVGGRDR